MVFGTPTTGIPFCESWWAMREAAVAADGDEHVEPEPPEVLDDQVRTRRGTPPAGERSCTGRLNGLPRLVVPRIVPPWATMPGDPLRRERG